MAMWGTARRRLAQFAQDDGGATAIEYALIAVGIAVAIALTVYELGDVVLAKYYDRLANELPK
ncbi:Flp family type IVb pilin [Methylopila musalis]|uniref:Flp family type IVb pilin n=1 Tax=Methylopila musalis TaxID=1134781 RepID=A0ABW3Z361_9HYPH